MGLRDIFRSAQKQEAKQVGTAWIPGMQDAPSRSAGRMIEAAQESPVLASIVDKISKTVASADWYAYRMRGKEEQRLADDTPIMRAFYNPNPWLSGNQTWALVQAYLELAAESFLWLERTNSGKPAYFWPLLPSWVRRTPGPSGGDLFELDANAGGLHLPKAVHASDMLWFRRPSLSSPYSRNPGMAIAVADELDTDENIAKYLKNFFYNDTTPSGLVSIEGISDAGARVFKHQLNSRHRGVDRAHQVLITNGKIDWKPLVSAMKDLQTSDLRTFERNIIIQRYGIPPEMLGIIENSNRATIESAAYLFAKFVIVPRLDAMATDLDKFAAMFDKSVRFGYDSPVPEDRAFILSTMAAFPQAYTVAEVRETTGHEVREGDDDESASQPAQQYAVTTSLSDYPVKVKELDEELISKVIEAIDGTVITNELGPDLKESTEEFFNKELSRLGISGAFNEANPAVMAHFEEVGMRLSNLNTTTQNLVRSTLREGIEDGERQKQLANRLRGILAEQGAENRAYTIARTEVATSSNFATYHADIESGVIVGNEWVSALAPLTRPEHEALNATRKKLGEMFVADSFVTDFPGNSGAAEHDINCMCSLVPLTADRWEELESSGDKTPAETQEKRAKAFEDSIAPWESRIRKTTLDAFGIQLDSAIQELYT